MSNSHAINTGLFYLFQIGGAFVVATLLVIIFLRKRERVIGLLVILGIFLSLVLAFLGLTAQECMTTDQCIYRVNPHADDDDAGYDEILPTSDVPAAPAL